MRVGRPRHSGTQIRHDEDVQATIRGVAAELFTAQGYANTSTREIAETVGMRQASLYYHYAGKQEILAAILADTVRPTLDHLPVVAELARTDPAAALYAFAFLDVRTLGNAAHNAGLLYRLPDVLACESCDDFRQLRAELLGEYTRIGSLVAETYPDNALLGLLLLQAVESVVNLRADGLYDDTATPARVAAALLRICGQSEVSIGEAAATAAALVPDLAEELAAT